MSALSVIASVNTYENKKLVCNRRIAEDKQYCKQPVLKYIYIYVL